MQNIFGLQTKIIRQILTTTNIKCVSDPDHALLTTGGRGTAMLIVSLLHSKGGCAVTRQLSHLAGDGWPMEEQMPQKIYNRNHWRGNYSSLRPQLMRPNVANLSEKQVEK